MDGIDLNIVNKDYNLAEVLLNSDDSDNSNKFNLNNDKALFLTNTSIFYLKKAVIQQTTSNSNIFNKLCMPYVKNKSSQTVQKDKSITVITTK